MAFPFIPGLSDQETTVVHGLTISATFAQIPNTPNWISNDCASYVHVDSYDMNMVCNSNKVFEWGNPIPSPQFYHWTNKEDILSTDALSPTAFMPVYDPDNVIDGISDFENLINSYAGRVTKSYTYSLQDAIIDYGNAYNKNAYPILASEGREHYLGLVTLTARNLAGTTWTGYYNNYPAQASNYPYIVSAEISYYYKANLSGNSAVLCPISFVAPPKDITLYAGADVSSNMYFHWYYTGKLAQFLGRTLLRAPGLNSGVYTPPAPDSQYYVAALRTANGFPYNSMKVYPGDLQNSIAPFCYFEFSDVEKAANCRGLPWIGGSGGLRDWHGINTTSDTCHLPIVNADGSTTPNGYQGAAIGSHYDDPYTKSPTSPLVNTAGVVVTPKDQTPDYPTLIPGNTDEMQLGKPSYTGVGCFGNYYALNKLAVTNLNDYLWLLDDNGWQNLLDSLKFWGNNPCESVMSFRLYPFDVELYSGAIENATIHFGRLNTMIPAKKIPDDANVILDLGETWINRANLALPDDFKAFTPYTVATLYIPFIGAVEFDLNHFMDAVMKIQMVVDLTTGTCTAVVYNNDMPYMYIPGTIGVDLPLTQNNVAQTSKAVLETTISAVSYMTAGIVHVASSSGMPSETKEEKREKNMAEHLSNEILGKATDVIMGSAPSIAADLLCNKSDMASKGSCSPASFMSQPLYCYLAITQQEAKYPRNYAHTYGYPCHTSDRLENFNGYTVCSNVDTTGIKATRYEQNLIKSLLESGVYL